MKYLVFFTLVGLPLIGEAEEIPVQSDSLRRLHQEDQRDWPVLEAAAVFPDESTLEGLALPGSHPIRPRNQHRRRRKRPRPQAPQEETLQPVPNQPPQGYQVSESPESGSIISRNPDRRYPEELPYIPIHQPNFQYQNERSHEEERRRPVESLDNVSQEEIDSQSFEHKNNFTPKRPRGHKNQYLATQEPETVGEMTDDTFKSERPLSSNSYRKPYSTKSQEQNSEAAVSPQDLKALLKQQSGSLSLSEILQQKNLSLADLLKGNRNALTALTSTTNQLSDAQDPMPSRRLPSRPKHQNADERSVRYSGKQGRVTEELTTEITVQRRLPPVKTPSRRKQALSNNRKPIRFRDEDTVDDEMHQRINKFVPSSPRRSTPHNTESSISSSTESTEVTNSIISDFEDDLSILNQNEKKYEESEERNEEISITTSTEHNEILPQTSEKPHLTNNQRPQIPLAVQETSVIDPVNIVPEEGNQKRLREKYLTRYRASLAQNSSKDDVIRRVRLPPANLFQNPRVTDKITSTEEPKTPTTQETTQNNSVLKENMSSTAKPQKELITSTLQPQEIDESSESFVYQIPRESSDVKTEQMKSSEDDDRNIIVGKPEDNILDELKIPDRSNNEDDGPMHKVIPFSTEGSSTKPNVPKTNSARDEILEFLQTDMGSERLARILASRNMTLAELIDHRERGSSQQHLAEIFRESNKSNVQHTEENESEEDTTNPNNNDQNEITKNILKNVRSTKAMTSGTTNTDIPSIQEMFEQLDKHKLNHDTIKHTSTSSESTSESSEETQVDSREHSESHEEQSSSKDKNILFDSLPTFPTRKRPIPMQNPFHPHTTPSSKPHQTPPPIFSFEPLNPHVNPGQRPIVKSRLTSTPPNNDFADTFTLLENIGQVRELGNKGKVNTYRDDDKRFDILFGNDVDEEITNDGGLPQDVKSAIIVSSAILGAAILGFLTIFVVCRWKQKRARRRFVDGIVNTKARSPILMQPEGKNSSGTLNPVMVNSNDLYKRDLSMNGESHMNPGVRKYYLWRTIRKTLRYK